MQKQLRLRISGKVQGVFFRAFVRDIARELGLKGYVRNMDDCSVEVVAAGPEPELRKLISECKRGPKDAEVTGIKESWSKPNQDFVSFEVQ